MEFFKQFLYGGDYNPEQWGEDIRQEDMRLFEKAHINSVTINVFSWVNLQPSEDEYDFSELDKIIQMLSNKNYQIVLATATAALPPWMFKKYPEVARTDYDGRHHKFGGRHNACPNSLVYQKYAVRLAGKLAERYGQNKQVVCWHINNEYGGECYCDNCEKAFRVWLKNKYKTIEAVNKAWNMRFWGHTLTDWDEIVVPNALSEGLGYDKTALAGLSLDYCRFNSNGMLNNFKLEKAAIRKHDHHTPITTNLMGTYKPIDGFKWAQEMDIVSWDNYPGEATPWSQVAMTHDLMRGLKHQPFMLMEQNPSQTWQGHVAIKRPGTMRAQSYQSIAHGADTIQFFQLRKSVGAFEKFHGAVIDHSGQENTRVFRECTQLGAELTNLAELVGSQSDAQVGVIFDWENYWAVEYISGINDNLKYVDQIHHYYRYFYEQNIAVDMLSLTGDFSRYKIIVAPVLYMVKAGVKEALEDFVSQGGTLVLTYLSGLVDQSDNVHLGGYPGPLRQLAGIWVEEIDALSQEDAKRIQFKDGVKANGRMLCDIIHPETAEVLAEYISDFYQSLPAVTKNIFQQGQVYYLGTELDDKGLTKIFDEVVNEQQVKSVITEKTELEISRRYQKGSDFYFIINFKKATLPLPQQFVGKRDLLTGKILTSNDQLEQYTTFVVKD